MGVNKRTEPNIYAQKQKFKKRKNSIFKKTMELSVLCDVKACAAVIGSDGKFETWPPNHTDFNSILSLYMAKAQQNKLPLVKKGHATATANHEVGASYIENQENIHTELLKKFNCAMGEFDVWFNGFCSRESMNEVLKQTEAKLEFLDQKIEFLNEINTNSKRQVIAAFEQQGESFSSTAANYDDTHILSPLYCSSSCGYDMYNPEDVANLDATMYVYQPQPLQSFITNSYLRAETEEVMIYDDIFASNECGGTYSDVISDTHGFCGDECLILEETKFGPVVSDNSSNLVSNNDFSFLENRMDRDLNDKWLSKTDLMMLEETEFGFLYKNNEDDIGNQYWSLGGLGDSTYTEQSPLDQLDQFLLAQMFPDQLEPYWSQFG